MGEASATWQRHKQLSCQPQVTLGREQLGRAHFGKVLFEHGVRHCGLVVPWRNDEGVRRSQRLGLLAELDRLPAEDRVK